MKKINFVKIGTTINISVDGKLLKKSFEKSEDADMVYKLLLIAKENPSDENLKNVYAYLNQKLRVAYLFGLEHDPSTGDVFLEGFNTPVPKTLLEVMEEYHNNNYPLTAIINFWKLLMINPDKRIRERLFDFIKTHDFVLTDMGYMLVYKAVAIRDKVDVDFVGFISNAFLQTKKWKCNPNKYVVYQNLSSGEYAFTKLETYEGWDEKEMNVELVGKVGDLFDSIFNDRGNILNSLVEEIKGNENVYTDKHTQTMEIKVGVPVKMNRTECNSDPAIECSYGLHVGATSYVSNFANQGDAVLACLVNPANVVAVPNYDHSKMRVSEYFPFAVATYSDGKIDIVEEKYFENDYKTYEMAELESMVEKIKAEELPIPTAIEAEAETRPMSELIKMIEMRMVDLS